MSKPEDRKAPNRDAESYEGRSARALAMGGTEKLARRKAVGILNVRERVDALVDAGTFIESGLFGVSGTRPEDKDKPAAAVAAVTPAKL